MPFKDMKYISKKYPCPLTHWNLQILIEDFLILPPGNKKNGYKINHWRKIVSIYWSNVGKQRHCNRSKSKQIYILWCLLQSQVTHIGIFSATFSGKTWYNPIAFNQWQWKFKWWGYIFHLVRWFNNSFQIPSVSE